MPKLDGEHRMDMLAAICREVQDADARMLKVVHVRVTPDAIPGSPVLVPFAPERLRLLAAHLVELPRGNAALVADPEAQQRWRELLLHTADWMAVLQDPHLPGDVVLDEPVTVMGIPVDLLPDA